MKRVLTFGYDYQYKQDLEKEYTDCLFIHASEVNYDSVERIVAMVGMVDEILSIIDNVDTSIEIAAVMMKKPIVKRENYPINKKDGEDNGESV